MDGAAIQSRTDEAIDFLKKFRLGGPWVLTAILPDTTEELKRTDTKTFDPHSEQELRSWIDGYQNRRNLYFMVNPPKTALSKKAEKSDVACAEWLFIDVDPRPNEDHEAERERAPRVVADKINQEPTIIIDSGGGFQFFWRLKEPVELHGPADVARYEAYNRQLIHMTLADKNCFNVDRIMRLPGTINLPTKTKQKKGRVAVLAKLVRFTDASWPLSGFIPAPIAGESGVVVTVPGSKVDLDALPIDDKLRSLLIHGVDLTEPSRHGSRSEWLWLATCELVRQGVDDATILALLLDKDLSISDSVLDKGKPEAYARRQLERARDRAMLGDVLWGISQKYFTILEGSKVGYYRENDDATLAPMDKAAFLHELATTRLEVEKGKKVLAAPIWLAHDRRRYYANGFVLDPSEEHAKGSYNLWKGFSVTPQPGDWSLMQQHIERVLASGDAGHADYITKWTAWALQNPADVARVALVFRGGEGVGKGLFANALVKLFGVHGMRIQNMAHLVGRFNAHLRHTCLLFADEAVVPDTEGEGAFKGLITEPTIPIERKGKDLEHAENHLHVIMATNNEWAVRAKADARRFAVFDVDGSRKGDHEYFGALVAQMLHGGGMAAMLHDLLTLKLGGWNPEARRPETRALNEQKERSLSPIEEWWMDCLSSAHVETFLAPGGGLVIPTEKVAQQIRERFPRDSATTHAVGRFLGKRAGLQNFDRGRPRGFYLPVLSIARQRWNEAMFPVDWDDSVDKWEGEWRAAQRDNGEIPF